MAESDHRRFVHSCDNLCSLSVRPERSEAKSMVTVPARNVLFDSAAHTATRRVNGRRMHAKCGSVLMSCGSISHGSRDGDYGLRAFSRLCWATLIENPPRTDV